MEKQAATLPPKIQRVLGGGGGGCFFLKISVGPKFSVSSIKKNLLFHRIFFFFGLDDLKYTSTL